MPDRAELTGVQQGLDTAAVGVEAQFVADDMQLAGCLGRLQHRPRLAGVHGHRLLAEHVRPGRQRGQGHGRVLDRGRGNADQVDLVAIQHDAPVVVGLWDAELVRCGLRAAHARAGERHDLRVLDVGKGWQVGVAGEAGANHRRTYGHVFLPLQ